MGLEPQKVYIFCGFLCSQKEYGTSFDEDSYGRNGGNRCHRFVFRI